MKRDYQAKVQHKVENRMGKFLQKSKLKHNDEISRINEERRRRLEKEMAGIERPAAQAANKTASSLKYVGLGVVCFCVMLFCMFYMLQRRIEGEKTTAL